MLERSRAVEVDREGLGERGGLRLVREEDRVRLGLVRRKPLVDGRRIDLSHSSARQVHHASHAV